MYVVGVSKGIRAGTLTMRLKWLFLAMIWVSGRMLPEHDLVVSVVLVTAMRCTRIAVRQTLGANSVWCAVVR